MKRKNNIIGLFILILLFVSFGYAGWVGTDGQDFHDHPLGTITYLECLYHNSEMHIEVKFSNDANQFWVSTESYYDNNNLERLKMVYSSLLFAKAHGILIQAVRETATAYNFIGVMFDDESN